MNIQAVWTDKLTEQIPKEKYEKIIQFMELLDVLNDKRIVINLDEDSVYECEDFVEWIYSRKEPELTDIKKELILKMSKCCHCEDAQIKRLQENIGEVKSQKYFALDFREDNPYYAVTEKAMYKICRKYLGMESKDQFKEDMEFCFPDIYFDVSTSIHSLNRKFEDIRAEIVEHLTALNSYRVNFIQLMNKNKGYREIAMLFQQDTGIECSPQGDKKKLSIFKREFVNESTGQKENINCELHTKFKRYNIDRDKQDRIYFAPAKEGICSNRVIVIHIGRHL